jgi:hypothetical protein
LEDKDYTLANRGTEGTTKPKYFFFNKFYLIINLMKYDTIVVFSNVILDGYF